MNRERLPNRRPCITFEKEFEGQQYTVSYGYAHAYGGGVKEVFINCGKSSTSIEPMMRDCATVLSHALQRGATPEQLAHSITRNPDANESPASIIGSVIDDMVMG